MVITNQSLRLSWFSCVHLADNEAESGDDGHPDSFHLDNSIKFGPLGCNHAAAPVSLCEGPHYADQLGPDGQWWWYLAQHKAVLLPRKYYSPGPRSVRRRACSRHSRPPGPAPSRSA